MTSPTNIFARSAEANPTAGLVGPFSTDARAIAALPAEGVRPLTICHFTVAHEQLKSRSFHRELLPLALAGVNIRYLSPMDPHPVRDGIRFVSLPRSRSRIWRAVASIGLLPLLLRQRASVYHFQDPQLLPAAFTLKLLFRKRVIYDAYEDFPALVAARKSIPRIFRSLAAKLLSGVESVAARCFDGILTADASTLRRFARYSRSRKLVFYNFPNIDYFPAPRARATTFDVVYRGGLSDRAGTGVLLDTMALLATRGAPLRLLLLGYFDDAQSEERFRQRIRKLNLESRVEIRGRIPHEEMAAALGSARVGVSPLLPVPKFLANIPVKIFEYWACGLPVVATDLPPMRPFFRHGEAGLLVDSSREEKLIFSMAESIRWLLDHPALAREMGKCGRALITERFNNAAEVPKLRRFCEHIAAAGMGA